MSDDHIRYVRLALERARGAVRKGSRPVASIIVRDGAITGEGRNTTFTDFDPSAHAEVTAIRQACGRRHSGIEKSDLLAAQLAVVFNNVIANAREAFLAYNRRKMEKRRKVINTAGVGVG